MISHTLNQPKLWVVLRLRPQTNFVFDLFDFFIAYQPVHNGPLSSSMVCVSSDITYQPARCPLWYMFHF